MLVDEKANKWAQSVFPKAVNVFGEKRHAEKSWRNVLIVALEDAIGKVGEIMALEEVINVKEHVLIL